jgi:hypothetical protein
MKSFSLERSALNHERAHRDHVLHQNSREAAIVADHKQAGNCCQQCGGSHLARFTTYCLKKGKVVNPYAICHLYEERK